MVISNHTSVSCAQVFQGVQHRVQVAGADAVVEVVGERLEVDVRGVEVGVQLPPRRRQM